MSTVTSSTSQPPQVDDQARQLLAEMYQMPAIDCHEHLRFGHMYDKSTLTENTFDFPGDLSAMLQAPYVCFWMPDELRNPIFWEPIPLDTTEKRQLAIDSLPRIKKEAPSVYRANLTVPFADLYDYDIDQLNLDDWEDLNARIVQNYADGPWQWFDKLCTKLHVERIVKINTSPGYYDTWLPTLSEADRQIEQRLFVCTLNIDVFMRCRPNLGQKTDETFNRLAKRYGCDLDSFEDYLELVSHCFDWFAGTPAVAFKTGMTGYRHFDDPPVAIGRGPELYKAKFEGDDKRDWHSLMFGVASQQAGRVGLPFGIHNGFDAPGHNSIDLEPVIADNPDTTFIIIHDSYPHYRDAATLAQRCANVDIDLTWVAVRDFSGAVDAYEHLLANVPGDRLTFGADAHYPETFYGMWVVHLEAIAAALSRLIQRDGWTPDKALDSARRLLYDNALRLYSLNAATAV